LAGGPDPKQKDGGTGQIAIKKVVPRVAWPVGPILNKKMKKFVLILIGSLAVLAVAGVIAFYGMGAKGSASARKAFSEKSAQSLQAKIDAIKKSGSNPRAQKGFISSRVVGTGVGVLRPLLIEGGYSGANRLDRRPIGARYRRLGDANHIHFQRYRESRR